MADQVYPDLPDPDIDPQAMLAAVAALKTTVETLIGTRGSVGWANQTFFQRDVPKASKTGDVWVRQAALAGEVDVISIWTGSQWQKLTL